MNREAKCLEYWQQAFGEDVSKIREVAIEASSLYHMDRTAYETSIQLFCGDNDPRAPFEHSVHIVDKLKEQIQNGKSISGELISFADEGHGISKEANILYMYNKIEEFICNKFGIDSYSANDCAAGNNTANV